jgi:hypothetical protein
MKTTDIQIGSGHEKLLEGDSIFPGILTNLGTKESFSCNCEILSKFAEYSILKIVFTLSSPEFGDLSGPLLLWTERGEFSAKIHLH